MFKTLLVLLVAVIHAVNGLHFYVQTGETKCFYEELPKDTLVVGKFDTYELNEGTGEYNKAQNLRVHITVDETFDNDHRVVSQKASSDGDFTFTSLDSGEHKFCLTPSYTHSSGNHKHRVFLDIVLGNAHDVIDSKRKIEVDALTGRVNELNSKLEEIHREQELMREREALFRDQSESTNSRVVRWTVIQLIVLIGTCFWQLRHLKGFFIKQKIV